MTAMRLGLLISLIATCFLATACSARDQVAAPKQSTDEQTIWVSVQFNVPRSEGIRSHFYSGRMSDEIYRQIIDGKLTSGMIVLRDVRYWNDADKLVKFEDESDAGTLVFRVQDLVKITLLKGDPWGTREGSNGIVSSESQNG